MFYNERGKAGGHEPPLFPLPFHTLAFLSSGSHEPPLFTLPCRGWNFENQTLKALNIPFKKVFLPGRVTCGGTEAEIVVAHGCRKTKKLICGRKGEIAWWLMAAER